MSLKVINKNEALFDYISLAEKKRSLSKIIFKTRISKLKVPVVLLELRVCAKNDATSNIFYYYRLLADSFFRCKCRRGYLHFFAAQRLRRSLNFSSDNVNYSVYTSKVFNMRIQKKCRSILVISHQIFRFSILYNRVLQYCRYRLIVELEVFDSYLYTFI